VFVPLTTLTMDPIPKAEMGYATSLYSVMRNIGSSMGISFVTTFLARRSQFHQSILAAHVSPYDEGVRQFLERAREAFLRGGSDATSAAREALATLYHAIQRQASLLSFDEAFRILGFLFLVFAPLALLMQRARHTRSGAAA
jgi:DHA2 family multidrug resistance protein